MAMATMGHFNTLKSFERLKKAGVPESQARELVEIMQESINDNTTHLATKADLQLMATKMATKADLEPIKTDIAVLKAGLAFMQRLFFGSTLIILLAIAGLYLHP